MSLDVRPNMPEDALLDMRGAYKCPCVSYCMGVGMCNNFFANRRRLRALPFEEKWEDHRGPGTGETYA